MRTVPTIERAAKALKEMAAREPCGSFNNPHRRPENDRCPRCGARLEWWIVSGGEDPGRMNIPQEAIEKAAEAMRAYYAGLAYIGDLPAVENLRPFARIVLEAGAEILKESWEKEINELRAQSRSGRDTWRAVFPPNTRA